MPASSAFRASVWSSINIFACLVAFAVARCGGAAGTDAGLDGTVADTGGPTGPVTVTLFDNADIHFADGNNTRTVDSDVAFPDTGPWQQVTLTLTLGCPSRRCDPWDRLGSLSLLSGSAVADGGWNVTGELEFARFVTPYKVGGTWTLDVTDLQTLFRGTRRARAFIDTWVGPGSSFGNGWLLTARMTFTPGTPSRRPVAVVPLGWSRAVYGDPARSIPSQLAPQQVRVPDGAGGAAVLVTTTGHGQGNRQNCAEFCAKNHSVLVDGTPHTASVWRDDCDQNPISNQQGTWTLSRAGWCPGDIVRPRVVDLGTTLAAGSTHTIGYDVEAFENTCRPGAMPCTGCTLGSACAYNDSSHTEPYYSVSGFVVFYAP